MPIKQYHYIYKTTNILNNKFYIGMHSTNDINDGYQGSGKRLKWSIGKHGKENHKTEILEYFQDIESLRQREKEIVNKELINEKLCMNLTTGGFGGFQYINDNDLGNQSKHGKLGGAKSKGRKNPAASAWLTRLHIAGKIKYDTFTGKQHTEATKRKMSNIKSGKNLKGDNANAKAVIDNEGNEFESMIECATFHNIHPETVSKRIKRNIYKFKE